MPRRTTGAATLGDVLAYENDEVVHKFLESYDVPFAEAREIFRQTRKYLWLAAKSQKRRRPGQKPPPRLAIDRTLLMLDEMWHVFILFTRDYTDFCVKYFGRYLHHAPVPHAEKRREAARAVRDPDGVTRARARSLRAQYEYVYDELGEDTVLQWFSEYPKRYTAEVVRSIRR